MLRLCDALRAHLHRYAEGELHDADLCRRVREHLRTCLPCQMYLERHDRLTRRIFSEEDAFVDGLASSRRVEETMDLIRYGSPPEWLASSSAAESGRDRFDDEIHTRSPRLDADSRRGAEARGRERGLSGPGTTRACCPASPRRSLGARSRWAARRLA